MAAAAASGLDALSVDDLRRLTDLGQVQRLLAQVEEAEIEIDRDLNSDLHGRHGVQLQLETLDALRPRLALLLGDVARLRSTVVGTSKLAEAVSAKVRQLDVEQSRVQDAIGEVENVLELKSCAAGVLPAISAGNYETAAVYIHRYRSFDPKLARMALASPVTGAAGEDVMTQAETELRTILVDEFQKAASKGDGDRVVRFFKLFPLLLMAPEGLLRYADYLGARVEQGAEASFGELRTANGGSQYAEFMTRLYEQVANVIDEEEPLVETHYSPGHMLTLLERLQRTVDKQMDRTATAFVDRVGVDRLLSSRAPTPADMKELDLVLVSLAEIIARSHLFLNFISGRMQQQLDQIAVDKAAQREVAAGTRQHSAMRLGAAGWANETPLAKRLQDLVVKYLALEELFMRRSVEKALQIDERDADSRTSSAVDDAFYIFKKCMMRAMATTDVDGLCAMVNVSARVFEDDFVGALRGALSTLYALEDTKEVRARNMITLNNADVAAEYVGKLKSELMGHVVETMDEDSVARQKIESVLAVFSDAAEPVLQLLADGVQYLFAHAFMPDVRAALQESLKEAKFLITDDEYDEAAARESFAAKFITDYSKAARQFQV